MGDVYGKNQQYGATSFVTADTMILIVSGDAGDITEYLVQQVAIQYARPLNRIYEIGSSNTYFAPGRAAGTCQISRIVGEYLITTLLGGEGEGLWIPDGNVEDKVLRFFNFNEGMAASLAFKMTGAIIDNYGMVNDANGMLVQENVSIQFAGLFFE